MEKNMSMFVMIFDSQGFVEHNWINNEPWNLEHLQSYLQVFGQAAHQYLHKS